MANTGAPPNFIQKIKKIMEDNPKPLSPSPFKYELSNEAAVHNSNILRKYNYDLTRVIAAHPNTELSYGSEFRSPESLQPILQSHRHWNYIKSSLTHGVKAKFKKLSNSTRLDDLKAALKRGNHKSAKSWDADLMNLVTKDVQFGFQMPITTEAALKIPHACLAPYGIIDQTTLDDSGNIVPKLRLAHDQSFKPKSGHSLNDRLDHEDFIPLTYRKCLLRTIHYIHALQWNYPITPIVRGKVDYRSAYY